MIQRKTSLNRHKRPNSVSKKKSSQNKSMKGAYGKMSLEREHICTGCGSGYNLTHSHIISRLSREDLADDIKNITYHCLKCHSLWESSGERVLLDDYIVNMEYIRYVDLLMFRNMIVNDYHYFKDIDVHCSENFEYLKNEYEKL